MENMEILLQTQGVIKDFPGVRALDRIDFNLKKGEVHGLLGENGSGKSTFVRILNGYFGNDFKGKILVDGKEARMESPRNALRMGMSMINQEIILVPTLSISENIFLGSEPGGRFNFVDDERMKTMSKVILDSLGSSLDPQEKVEDLSIGETQIVEIARAMRKDPRIIAMDEPTSSLSREGIQKLFDIIRKLKRKGVSIIYISHRIPELMEICDRISILKNGRLIETVQPEETSPQELVRMMVGQEMDPVSEFSKSNEGSEDESIFLSVRDITKHGSFYDVSFDIPENVILGLTGLMGAGKSELARAIAGIDRVDGGGFLMGGKAVSLRSPRDAMRHGIFLVPEDRRSQGIFPDMAVRENVTVSTLDRISCSGFINREKEIGIAEHWVERLGIVCPGIEQKIQFLSGGNQQKVIVARCLEVRPRLLILDEPTRGMDVRAKGEIRHLISGLPRAGITVILCSSEMDEILTLSDRTLVLCKGRIAGNFRRDETTKEKVMASATGGTLQ
jgi:ABC-type sugar transport system ATPase subunit